MNQNRIFRALVVLYLLSFVLAHVVVYRQAAMAPEAAQYALVLQALFFDPWGSIPSTLFIWANFFIMLAGAVTLLFRIRPGLYLFVVGSLMMRAGIWFVSAPDAYPSLQSTTSSQVDGLTCVLWGAIVASALSNMAAPSR